MLRKAAGKHFYLAVGMHKPHYPYQAARKTYCLLIAACSLVDIELKLLIVGDEFCSSSLLIAAWLLIAASHQTRHIDCPRDRTLHCTLT